VRRAHPPVRLQGCAARRARSDARSQPSHRCRTLLSASMMNNLPQSSRRSDCQFPRTGHGNWQHTSALWRRGYLCRRAHSARWRGCWVDKGGNQGGRPRRSATCQPAIRNPQLPT
jgi:hypothetical protein